MTEELGSKARLRPDAFHLPCGSARGEKKLGMAVCNVAGVRLASIRTYLYATDERLGQENAGSS
jgi:hypothetical protein